MPRAGLDRTTVIGAAVDLVNESGTDSLSLAGLASRLGVRPPSLYNHVAGLEDLKAEIALRGIGELGGRMGAAAVGLTHDDAIGAIAHAYRTFAQECPGLYLAAISWTLADDPEHRRQAARVVGIVTRVLASYGVEGEEAMHAARALRSALHGFVSLEAVGGFASLPDRAASFGWVLRTITQALETKAQRT